MADPSMADELIQADRELRPDVWAKVDAIAEMIDPGAFAIAYNVSAEGAPPIPFTTRQKYYQSAARHTAFQILKYLGLEPETTDWEPIFQRVRANRESATEEPS